MNGAISAGDRSRLQGGDDGPRGGISIGNATLYLGDCLQIIPQLPDNSIDLIFTDPPFGHKNNDGDLISKRESALGRGKSGPARPICNDGPEADELAYFIFKQSPRILKQEGCCCCCCCGGGGPDPMFARWSLEMDKHLTFKQMIVWDKGPMGMGWHYRRSYETILVGHKGTKCKWHDESNKVENIIRPRKGIKKIIPSMNQHPTEKPPELAGYFINLHSQEGETVFDPFMGSGSTAIASLTLKRKFIGIELDETWFNMAVDKIRRFYSQGRLF